MLNLTPLSSNTLVVYADTVSDLPGWDYFTIVFTNTTSKETFAVIPTVVRRNYRFIEFEVELVGVNELNSAMNGQIYLFPDGNFTYSVFRTDAPTLTFVEPLNQFLWNNVDDFWNFSEIVWNVWAVDSQIIDRGQAFLYSNVPCEREIEYVAYPLGNNIMESIVYVANTPLYQFPCTIAEDTTFTVLQDTVTYCPVITIENNATLNVPTPFVLSQLTPPWGYCP